MDPNIVQVEIVGESLLSDVVMPLAAGFGGIMLGAMLSWLMMRWQMKRSLELEIRRRTEAESAELQNVYRSLLIGVEGYWTSIEGGRKDIMSVNEQVPTFIFGGPVAHRLPGYDESRNLIMKIPDVGLLESVMATHYSISDFAAIVQAHNEFFKRYDESFWRFRHSSDDVDKSQARTLKEQTSLSVRTVKQRLNVVENNVKHLIELLHKSITQVEPAVESRAK